jgi:hypothetical protein
MQCGRWETHVLAGTLGWIGVLVLQCSTTTLTDTYISDTLSPGSFLPSALLCNLNITSKQPSTWHTQGHQVEDDTVHPSLSCFGAYYYYVNSSVSLQPSLQPRVSKPSIPTQKWCAYWTLWEYMNDFFCVNKLRVLPYNNITHRNT